jgi:RNA polymerase sigma-70 factor (ECF subfamily)
VPGAAAARKGLRLKSNDTSALVARAASGDPTAFEGIVGAHHRPVRAYIASRLDDPHDVDDLAQEVFLAAYRSLPRFDIRKEMGPWLHGIAVNCLRNHFRAARKQKLVDGALADLSREAEDPATGEDLANQLDALRECLAGLDRRTQDLVRRRYFQGHAVSRICSSTGKKHSAVTMALHRIRIALRACVDGKVNPHSATKGCVPKGGPSE